MSPLVEEADLPLWPEKTVTRVIRLAKLEGMSGFDESGAALIFG
jgi:hypothetical protein